MHEILDPEGDNPLFKNVSPLPSVRGFVSVDMKTLSFFV